MPPRVGRVFPRRCWCPAIAVSLLFACLLAYSTLRFSARSAATPQRRARARAREPDNDRTTERRTGAPSNRISAALDATALVALAKCTMEEGRRHNASTIETLAKRFVDEHRRDTYIHDGTHTVPLASLLCDPYAVPFDPAADGPCVSFVAAAVDKLSTSVIKDGTLQTNGTAVVFLAGEWTVELRPMGQKFEQRTIKFLLTLTKNAGSASSKSASFLLKVPQLLFHMEPFSETAAFAIDRLMGINRVPPTAVVSFPVAALRRALEVVGHLKLVPEFAVASNVKTFAEWLEHDLFDFVAGKQKYGNATHVYASVQLHLIEVVPLLESVFVAPYSKAQPGWHRWLDIDYQKSGKFKGDHATLYALSELASFDFVTLNADRSPNKNNFVAGGCPLRRGRNTKRNKARGGVRRPSGMVPSFVHLDQGMAFAGLLMEHNPLAKTKNVALYCVYYGPLIRRLRCMTERLLSGAALPSQQNLSGGRASDDEAPPGQSTSKKTFLSPAARAWGDVFVSSMPTPVVTGLGESLLRKSARQIPALLSLVDQCVARWGGEAMVLGPPPSWMKGEASFG